MGVGVTVGVGVGVCVGGTGVWVGVAVTVAVGVGGGGGVSVAVGVGVLVCSDAEQENVPSKTDGSMSRWRIGVASLKTRLDGKIVRALSPTPTHSNVMLPRSNSPTRTPNPLVPEKRTVFTSKSLLQLPTSAAQSAAVSRALS